MLKTKIKASRITNLTDARYFSAWDVEYIGFNLEEGNDSYIKPHLVVAMKEWLEGPKFIGELGSFPDVEEVKELVEKIKLDGIQVGTFCEPNLIRQIHTLGIPIIKEIVWSENSDWDDIFNEYDLIGHSVECFIIDFSHNNFQMKDVNGFNENVKQLCANQSTFIDIEIPSQEINSFLENVNPKGLAIKGGDEEKVGYKSFDEVDKIFEALEIFE